MRSHTRRNIFLGTISETNPIFINTKKKTIAKSARKSTLSLLIIKMEVLNKDRTNQNIAKIMQIRKDIRELILGKSTKK